MLFPNVATALLVSASIVSGLSIQARDTDFHAIRRARLEARQNNNFRNGGNGNNGNQFNRNGQNNGQGNNNNNNNNAAASSAAAAATPATGGNNNNNNNNAAAAKTLNANAVQTGSAATGQTGVIAAGQVESAVDTSNFINFCSGKTLTNGLQVTGGSCNGIVMGNIPSSANMISGILTNPKPGDVLKAGETFTVSVQTQNLVAGAFTNAQLTYYSAPQDLSGGKVVGHTHVTIQDIGNSLTPTTPPNPAVFAFFKGINDAGNGKGLLSATVTGGLPAGFYRVCTMTSSSNHQPVLMPVAQRGAQDDCTKFQVTAAGGNNNANANAAGGNNAGKSNTAAAAAAATSAVKGNGNAAASSVAAAKTSAVKGNGGKAASTSVAAAAAKTSAVKSNGSKAASTSVAAAAATKAATAASGASAGASSVTVKSGSLGGSAPLVTASGNADRPFEVNGNTFVAAANAVERSCDIQFNTCADLANSGKLNGKTVSDCTTQKASCTQG